MAGLAIPTAEAQVTIFNTLGSFVGGGQTYKHQAQSFLTTAGEFVIESVSFRVSNPDSRTQNYSFSIYSFDAATHKPAAFIADVGTGSASTLTAAYTTITFSGLGIALSPSTQYFMVLDGSATGGVSGIRWQWASTNDSSSVNTWKTFDSSSGNAVTAIWDPASQIITSGPVNPYMMSISAGAIPEPGTYALLAGLGALGVGLWRRKRNS